MSSTLSLHAGKVIEIGSLHYDVDQTDDQGNILPVGSIKVRIFPTDNNGNVIDVYARPMTHVIGLPPALNEYVVVFAGPSESSTPGVRNASYYYFPFPLNATDDVAINSMREYRSKDPLTVPSLDALKILSGIPTGLPVRPIAPVQKREKTLALDNGSGATISVAMSVKKALHYAQDPSFEGTGTPGDPHIAMTLDKPGTDKFKGFLEKAVTVASNLSPVVDKASRAVKKASQKYRQLDEGAIATGIYAGLSQRYPKLRLGRSCLPITKSIPNFNGPQVIMDASRVVMNAKEDNAFMLAKKTAAIEGRKIHLVTDRHNVDFDTLMDNIIDLSRQVMKIGTAQAPLATVMGPTGFALNFPQLIKIFLNFLRFATIPCFPLSFPKPGPRPDYDYGMNTVTPFAQETELTDNPSNPNQQSIAQCVGASCSSTGQLNPVPGDGKPVKEGEPEPESELDKNKCSRYLVSNLETQTGILIYRDCSNERKTLELSGKSTLLEGICILKIEEKDDFIKLVYMDDNCSSEEEPGIKFPIDPIRVELPECSVAIYEASGRIQSQLSRNIKDKSYALAVVVGKDSACENGWYLLPKLPIPQEPVDLSNATLLTKDVLADDDCLIENLQKIECKESEFITTFNLKRKAGRFKV